jgi:hypothetical protein
MSNTPDKPISVKDVETALDGGLSTNYPSASSKLTFNDSLVRTLAGKPSGIISMNDMRNKAGPTAYGTILRTTSCSGSSMGTIMADGRYGEIAGPPILNSPACGLTLSVVDRYVTPDRLAIGYFGPGLGGSLSPLTGSAWVGNISEIWTSDVDNNGAPQYTTLKFSTSQPYNGNYKITDIATNKQIIVYGYGIYWTTNPSPYDNSSMFDNWIYTAGPTFLIRIEKV